jgi:hypothetical protein
MVVRVVQQTLSYTLDMILSGSLHHEVGNRRHYMKQLTRTHMITLSANSSDMSILLGWVARLHLTNLVRLTLRRDPT